MSSLLAARGFITKLVVLPSLQSFWGLLLLGALTFGRLSFHVALYERDFSLYFLAVGYYFSWGALAPDSLILEAEKLISRKGSLNLLYKM